MEVAADDRRLVLVATPDDAPDEAPGIAAVVVLDTAWTPPPGTRPDLLAVRPLIADVLRRTDFFIDSYERLEAWANAVGLPERLMADGVSWWYRRRLGYWHWLHERLLWRTVLDACLGRVERIRVIDLRADAPALADVASSIAMRDGIAAELPTRSASDPAGDGTPTVDAAPTGFLSRLVTAPARRARRRELLRRAAVLAARVDRLATAGDRFLYVTDPRVHQIVRTPGGERRVDPFLASIAERLEADGVGSIVMDLGADIRAEDAWPALEGDEGRLPATLLATRWETAADRAASVATSAAVEAALADAPNVPLLSGGIDLAPPLLADVRRFARVGLQGRLREARRVTRMLRELRPRGVVLIDEYGRIEWLAAARAAGVPAFAVQHGIIYPWHLGYRHPRATGLPFAQRTFVFGDYERRVLLAEGGYRREEVEVTGAPRLDLARAAGPADRTAEREAVRRELGIAAGDRMLVISTTFERLHRRFYWTHALAALLDVELPNVHLVFKQHPGEADEGPYRALITGLAAAAGRQPPPMSVVRDVDLYRLLRAADAHLGLFSTVLTDAVATGTPNLVALTQAHRDLLGYVEAGVARGVRDGHELVAALDDPWIADEARRAAFLDDHFRVGDASARIRDGMLRAVAEGEPGPRGDDPVVEAAVAAPPGVPSSPAGPAASGGRRT